VLPLLALSSRTSLAFVGKAARLSPPISHHRPLLSKSKATTPLTMVALPRLPTTKTAQVVQDRLQKVQKQIGNLLMAPPPPPPVTVVEGAALFRTLGVAPNAEYDEVTRAVNELKEKYKDDKKMCMKLEITKDKINELRLKQRTQGSLAVTSAAAKIDRSTALFEKTKFKRQVQKSTPRWVKRLPLMWKPWWKIKDIKNPKDRKLAQTHWDMSKTYFIGFEVVTVLFPIAVGAVKAFSFIFFYFHLATKGKEPVQRLQGMAVEVKPERLENYVWGFLLILPFFITAFLVSTFTAPFLTFVRPQIWQNMCTVLALFLADNLFQPHLVKPEK